MSGYCRVFLAGHVASPVRLIQGMARFKFEFRFERARNGPYQVSSGRISVYARSAALVASLLTVRDRTPLFIEGELRGGARKLYLIDAHSITVIGIAHEKDGADNHSITEHKVAGHWRTLADGREVWVRAHNRGG